MIVRLCETCYTFATSSKTAWLIKEEAIIGKVTEAAIRNLIASRSSHNLTIEAIDKVSLSESGDFLVHFRSGAGHFSFGILVTGEDATDFLKLIESLLIERAEKYQKVVSRVSPEHKPAPKTKSDPPPVIKLPQNESRDDREA